MNEVVLKDIEETIKLIEKQKKYSHDRYGILKSEGFSKISPCYLYSNENISEYMPYFDINDGSVLTVCGSGDQVLSSILYGAKKVDTFDSNKLAYYNLKLKLAVLKTLGYEEFINFYSIDNSLIDRLKCYKDISDNILNTDIKLYWDEIFKKSPNEFIYLFYGSAGSDDLLKRRIPYLNYDNYVTLKENINNADINFKNIDLLQICNEFNGKYNFINLSNIYTYIKDKNKFIEFINNLKKLNLANNGSILLNYYWNNKCGCDDIVFEYLKANTIPIDDLAINNYNDSGMIKVLKKISD